MGAGSFEEEKVFVNPVNEEPVGLDVAFAVMVPVTGEAMIPVFLGKGFAGLEEIDDCLDLVEVVAAPGGKAQVALKAVGGPDDEQDLEAHLVAEVPETLV